MKNIVHVVASVVAFSSIGGVLLATIVVELFGALHYVALVKSLIVYPGMFVLVPAMAVMAGSGIALASERKGRLITAKKKRMPFVAANGALIRIPSAIFLDMWASSGSFDSKFYVVQTLEILAGGVNLALLGLNMRDGLRLSGRFR